MTAYTAREFDSNQKPATITFTAGKRLNKPSTDVMAEYATHAAVIAVTGLDSGQAQVATATDSGAIYVSSLGQTTFKKVGTTAETITATSGAIGLDNDIVYFDTTAGASTSTLAAGVAGQVIMFVMAVDGGDQVLTPASYLNGTTVTFDDAGDSIILASNGTSWYNVGTPTATVA